MYKSCYVPISKHPRTDENAIYEPVNRNFTCSAISGRGGFAISTHFIHPSAAIGGVAAKYKSALLVHANVDLKTGVGHVGVNRGTRIALPGGKEKIGHQVKAEVSCIMYSVLFNLKQRSNKTSSKDQETIWSILVS